MSKATASPTGCLRVATFNVHGFKDARGKDNFSRVESIIKEHRPHVLCLQETGSRLTEQLHAGLSSHLFHKDGIHRRGTCAVLSQFPIRKLPSGGGRLRCWPRYANCLVEVPGSVFSRKSDREVLLINVTCVHLSHALEPKRIRELERIAIDLQTELKNSEKQDVFMKIISGDFNALTLSDYSEEELNKVAEVRRNNRWEEPKNEVTKYTKETMKFQDAKDILRGDLQGPLSTCKFNTRIDYVYVKEGVKNVDLRVDMLRHVEDSASDHNMVYADITVGDQETLSEGVRKLEIA